MGEAALKRSATRRFVELYPACCFCAGLRPSTTREHMPPKSLFNGSHRPDRLVMPACGKCNRATSTADLTAAIISRWAYDATVVENLDHSKLSRRARVQAPDLLRDWTKHASPLHTIKGREHLRKHGVPVPHDAAIVTIGPLTIRQLNLSAHKAALALYFEHFRRPLSERGLFSAYWKTKEDFARSGVPRELLELFPEYGTLTQGRWNESETFEYRRAISRDDGLFGFFARLRRGLFISGFVLDGTRQVVLEGDDWMKGGDLLALVESPRFAKKL
jgi:hypothetical protein